MKRQDYTDTKALDIKSLKGKVKSLNEEISGLVLDKNMSGLKDSKSIGKKRKDLAQVMTVLRQKELLEMLGKAEESAQEGATK